MVSRSVWGGNISSIVGSVIASLANALTAAIFMKEEGDGVLEWPPWADRRPGAPRIEAVLACPGIPNSGQVLDRLLLLRRRAARLRISWPNPSETTRPRSAKAALAEVKPWNPWNPPWKAQNTPKRLNLKDSGTVEPSEAFLTRWHEPLFLVFHFMVHRVPPFHKDYISMI